jgi:hypothetical protein
MARALKNPLPCFACGVTAILKSGVDGTIDR